MNYKESAQILEEIGSAKNILLIFHEGVDPDSITSNLVLKNYLESVGKKVDIAYKSDIADLFRELYGIENVLEKIDFRKFKFKDYDLLIALDVNEPRRLGIPEGFKIPIKTINIDHHASENAFDGLKLTDSSYSSTAEIVFYLLEDFGFKIDKINADLILLGIITDTESFNYGVSARVFRTVSRLIELGADFEQANVITYRNNPLDKLKFWSVALNNTKIDKKYKFAYTSISSEEFANLDDILQAGRSVADKFIRTLKGTNFGIVMTEKEKGELKISIRSRIAHYGILELLSALGGGGHFDGGGALIKGLPYDKAVKKVLLEARKFVKKRAESDEKKV